MMPSQKEINLITFVLEDDAIVQKMITEVFKLNGLQDFLLFTKSDKMLANEEVDICVIDYLLGDQLDGLAVMKIIRERNPECFVIIMSAQNDREVVIDFLNAGANKYVDKLKKNYLQTLVQYVQEGIVIAKRKKELNQILKQFKAAQDARR
jgi:DNA-binding NtrC family response regulator